MACIFCISTLGLVLTGNVNPSVMAHDESAIVAAAVASRILQLQRQRRGRISCAVVEDVRGRYRAHIDRCNDFYVAIVTNAAEVPYFASQVASIVKGLLVTVEASDSASLQLSVRAHLLLEEIVACDTAVDPARLTSVAASLAIRGPLGASTDVSTFLNRGVGSIDADALSGSASGTGGAGGGPVGLGGRTSSKPDAVLQDCSFTFPDDGVPAVAENAFDPALHAPAEIAAPLPPSLPGTTHTRDSATGRPAAATLKSLPAGRVPDGGLADTPSATTPETASPKPEVAPAAPPPAPKRDMLDDVFGAPAPPVSSTAPSGGSTAPLGAPAPQGSSTVDIDDVFAAAPVAPQQPAVPQPQPAVPAEAGSPTTALDDIFAAAPAAVASAPPASTETPEMPPDAALPSLPPSVHEQPAHFDPVAPAPPSADGNARPEDVVRAPSHESTEPRSDRGLSIPQDTAGMDTAASSTHSSVPRERSSVDIVGPAVVAPLPSVAAEQAERGAHDTTSVPEVSTAPALAEVPSPQADNDDAAGRVPRRESTTSSSTSSSAVADDEPAPPAVAASVETPAAPFHATLRLVEEVDGDGVNHTRRMVGNILSVDGDVPESAIVELRGRSEHGEPATASLQSLSPTTGNSETDRLALPSEALAHDRVPALAQLSSSRTNQDVIVKLYYAWNPAVRAPTTFDIVLPLPSDTKCMVRPADRSTVDEHTIRWHVYADGAVQIDASTLLAAKLSGPNVAAMSRVTTYLDWVVPPAAEGSASAVACDATLVGSGSSSGSLSVVDGGMRSGECTSSCDLP